jgi:hypothetical protein
VVGLLRKQFKVANTLWTTQNFQTTDAEDGNEAAPYPHRFDVQTAGPCPGENDVPEKGMFYESDWRGIQGQK